MAAMDWKKEHGFNGFVELNLFKACMVIIIWAIVKDIMVEHW